MDVRKERSDTLTILELNSSPRGVKQQANSNLPLMKLFFVSFVI